MCGATASGMSRRWTGPYSTKEPPSALPVSHSLRGQGRRLQPWRPWSPRCGSKRPLGLYEGHFKKRATVSGEYHGTSGETLLVMQPGKNSAQYVLFSAAVAANGFNDRSARMHASTAESHISFLHVSPAGDARTEPTNAAVWREVNAVVVESPTIDTTAMTTRMPI